MIFTVSAVMARRPGTHVIALAHSDAIALSRQGGKTHVDKGSIACWEVGGRVSQADAADKVDRVPGAYGKGPLATVCWSLEKRIRL